jgi:hypothetical protein
MGQPYRSWGSPGMVPLAQSGCGQAAERPRQEAEATRAVVKTVCIAYTPLCRHPLRSSVFLRLL